MELKEYIYRRKSTRSYKKEPVDEETLQKIEDFIGGMKPLLPDVRYRCRLLPGGQVRSVLPWVPAHAAAIYTEDKKGALENAGFLLQQLDLYVQSLGLGACWLGMGSLPPEKRREDGLELAMLLVFGVPKGEALRPGAADFRRKPMALIADRMDTKLECARLAPSSVNSQPWYFLHGVGAIHVYCALSGAFRKAVSRFNHIDMGIALCHLYLENEQTFRFFYAPDAPEQAGYAYIGSVQL